MTDLTPEQIAQREAARTRTGEFGTHDHTDPEIDLDGGNAYADVTTPVTFGVRLERWDERDNLRDVSTVEFDPRALTDAAYPVPGFVRRRVGGVKAFRAMATVLGVLRALALMVGVGQATTRPRSGAAQAFSAQASWTQAAVIFVDGNDDNTPCMRFRGHASEAAAQRQPKTSHQPARSLRNDVVGSKQPARLAVRQLVARPDTNWARSGIVPFNRSSNARRCRMLQRCAPRGWAERSTGPRC